MAGQTYVLWRRLASIFLGGGLRLVLSRCVFKNCFVVCNICFHVIGVTAAFLCCLCVFISIYVFMIFFLFASFLVCPYCSFFFYSVFVLQSFCVFLGCTCVCSVPPFAARLPLSATVLHLIILYSRYTCNNWHKIKSKILVCHD